MSVDYTTLRRYADSNHVPSMRYLGFMSDKGKDNIPQDSHLAFTLFSRIVELCSNPQEQAITNLSETECKQNLQYAHFYLGYLYEKGRGCEQDNIQSFKHYMEAKELGPIAVDSQADQVYGEILVALGNRYEVRLGDWGTAMKLYEEAVNEKEASWYDICVSAYLFMGLLYERGGGGPEYARDPLQETTQSKSMRVERNLEKAFECYQALQRSEYEEKVKSFVESLEEQVSGHGNELFALGLLYEKGLCGKEQNVTEAYKHYSIVANSDHEEMAQEAKRRQKELVEPSEFAKWVFGKRPLTSEEIQQGENLVTVWKEHHSL